MTRVRVRGFQIFTDRTGKVRCYHRATRIAVDLGRHPIGSAGFVAECARITAIAAKGADAGPGTLGRLIERYRAHTAFTGLAERTQRDYQRVFDYLKPISDTPLTRFTSPLVVKLRDKANDAHGFHFANYTHTVLRIIFGWGRERGYLKTNPALEIKSLKRPKNLPDANRPWTDSERDVVLKTLPDHMRLPIALMMFCGLDPQDALSLSKSCVSGNQIDTARGKTREPVWLPMPDPLVEILVNAPQHDAITLCANSRGLPWTKSGFRASWRLQKNKLEANGQIAPGLTLKGLRHTVATILAEMGHTPESIKNILGQKTDAMARHYSRHANMTKANSATVSDFNAELNRRSTKLVKPSE